jgi:hypothetical protein
VGHRDYTSEIPHELASPHAYFSVTKTKKWAVEGQTEPGLRKTKCRWSRRWMPLDAA